MRRVRSPKRRTERPPQQLPLEDGRQESEDAARDSRQAKADARLAAEAARHARRRPPYQRPEPTLFPPRYEISVYCPTCHAAQVFVGCDAAQLGRLAAAWQRAHEEQNGGVGTGHTTLLGAALLGSMARLPVPPAA